MNKSQLNEIISQKANITKKKAETVVNIVFDSMSHALTDNDRIEIRGFGSFVNKAYEAYQGRNPRTGQTIQVSPKRLPFFKVGKELKELVDGQRKLEPTHYGPIGTGTSEEDESSGRGGGMPSI